MRFLLLAAVLVGGCNLPQHGRNCGAITDASLEDMDTIAEPKLTEIARRKLTPHEQVHLAEAIFGLKFPDSKVEPLKALIVNPSFCPEARQEIEKRAAEEGETLRVWVRAALGDVKAEGGWWGLTVGKSSMGLKVTKVAIDSPAGRAGVQEGDVVVAIGDRAVSDVVIFEEAGRTLEQKGAVEVPLDVIRGTERFKLLLRR
jgi:predicted metalloprotease with PDZ domain